jgi:hypothetical protein
MIRPAGSTVTSVIESDTFAVSLFDRIGQIRKRSVVAARRLGSAPAGIDNLLTYLIMGNQMGATR